VLKVEEKFCNRVTTLLVFKSIVETRVPDCPVAANVVLYKDKVQPALPILPL